MEAFGAALFSKEQNFSWPGGPNEPKNVPNGRKHVILTIWDPFGPHRDIGKPAMLGHFWSQMGHFWTPPDLEWDLERG